MSDAAGIFQLVGRILFGGYFVFTGAGFHIPKNKMAEEYARSMRFPVPAVAGWPFGRVPPDFPFSLTLRASGAAFPAAIEHLFDQVSGRIRSLANCQAEAAAG
jgi:hypothetical protein